MQALPRVTFISTGGTIDHVGRDRLDLAFYTESPHRLTAEQLLARVPELRAIADVGVHPFVPLRGQSIGWPDLIALSAAVRAAAAEADGIVVTRGTNTLEEAAYFLALTAALDVPVVVTGAMRPASAMSGDGDLNIVNAVRAAASPALRGAGAVVLMNDEIFAARDVTKTSTYRVHSFGAPATGALGGVGPDGVVRIHARCAVAGPTFQVSSADDLPRVDIALSYLGADGAMIDAVVAAGARGIISAGAGTGRGTSAEEAAFDRARARGVVVCQATRVLVGPVVRSSAMRERGIVAAGTLSPWKARILLALALQQTSDPAEIQSIFDRA